MKFERWCAQMSESQDPPDMLRYHRMLCCQHFEPSLFSTYFKHLQQCSLCDLAKIFFASKFSYLLLFSPTPKLRQQIGGGSTNSKPPGPIIVMGQSETLISSQIKLITLFSPSGQRWCAFHQPRRFSNYAEPNWHT
jgi:hypothetical protein